MSETPWPLRVASATPAIETLGLRKRYGRSVVALDGIDLTVPEGSTYLLVGPNGAGKTTTLSILLDLTRRSEGEVRVLGHDPASDGAQVRARIGYVPERADFGYGWMKVRALLRHHAVYRPGWDADYAAELERALELESDRKFGKLSKGQARRVELLMALAHRPRLLLLDEPTDGLDPLMRERVLELLADHIRRFPTTTFISTHLIHEADRLADHVAVLDRGTIVVQAEREALMRSMRRWSVPGDARPPAELEPAIVSRTTDRTGPVWTVWGEEAEVRPRLERAGVTPVTAARPSLEQAAVAFLARGSRARLGEDE